MTNVQSKFPTTIAYTCKDVQHAWTNDCANAAAGALLAATPYCLRLYTLVYALSLIMRHRIPTRADLKNTLKGILQSTCFLVTNAYTYVLYNCLVRQLLGHYKVYTVGFVPAFLASLTAILIERPARRPLLALYVANVATESVWNMARARGLVHPLPHGQTAIFGVSISILLYLYRLGVHRSVGCKDSLFDILRTFVGHTEEGPSQKPLDTDASAAAREQMERPQLESQPPLDFRSVAGLVRIYSRFIDALKRKHATCPHRQSCIRYAIIGGLKPFLGGLSIQVALKLVMNIKRITQMKMNWQKTFLDKSTLKLGVFLGSFSLLYKAISCTLRHIFGYDDPRFAIPAGLISSLAFTQYPDITVALYVMWKMLQIVYNLGVEKGFLPKLKGFTVFLYCFSTAILFHVGIFESNNLRSSYFKFLCDISGERFLHFNLKLLDAFGLNSTQSQLAALQRYGMVAKGNKPLFPM